MTMNADNVLSLLLGPYERKLVRAQWFGVADGLLGTSLHPCIWHKAYHSACTQTSALSSRDKNPRACWPASLPEMASFRFNEGLCQNSKANRETPGHPPLASACTNLCAYTTACTAQTWAHPPPSPSAPTQKCTRCTLRSGHKGCKGRKNCLPR